MSTKRQTPAEELWWAELRRLWKRMPAGFEVVVDGAERASMYPAGALREHLDSPANYHGMPVSHISDRFKNLYPYGEGQ
jgi:hypothetical protein